ncbi:nucleoside hydrolase [Mycobacterium sp. PSTR-4-N]|uniref:nucleoside hydrolase n=1 Tax=Mycobacterium sp. PSTR-4-N TaxID=2917745 RepID=UPI001F14EC46|nr:nucleoside hydrolase [Mycobacterium sp. PSTR-4-N]MCG7595523.1 nucleoside hydrolase [Mycobacterium sp. PSTR-4-N]
MFRLAAVAVATAALAFSALAAPPHGRAAADACVVIDTDLDIDDMMSMPMVVGNRHVAAVVATEGFTTPELGAAAISRLLAEPEQRTIPVIVGAGVHRSDADIAAGFGDFVLVFRELMNRLNDFLPTALPPAPRAEDYVQRVADAVATCRQVDVLLLGPLTSFVDYEPAIRPKIGRVVISGRPVNADSDLEAVESFNCSYDRPSCATVFHDQLPGLTHSFVDVPRSDCDLTPNRAGCKGTVYGPTLEMVRALGPVGLPNTLKQILLNHTNSWAADTWEHSGYGGRSLFWDQSAALELLAPELFRDVGPYRETTLSPADFQRAWVERTNSSVSYA